MLRLAIVLCISLSMSWAYDQSTSKYQVGTITEVKIHRDAGGASDAVSYDVSVKVGDTIYVVLYKPPLGEETVRYAAGRELLVLVGKSTIRYNDIVGRSFEVPIESQTTAAKPKQAKPSTAR
jgi:translation initiation factor IF-2